MIDHIFVSATPALPAVFVDGEGNAIAPPAVGRQAMAIYEGQRVDILGIKIVRAPAVLDEEGVIVTPEETAPGYWCAVRSKERLADLPGLVIVTDSDLAAAEQPFVLYKSPDYEWSQLQSEVWPSWCGDRYPWGAVGPDKLVA